MTGSEDIQRRAAGMTMFIREPYRIFFPLGAMWAFVGVAFWVPKAMPPLLEDVSTKVHVWVQIYGFIWSFVIGFLGTAVPRLTRTPLLRTPEVATLVLLSCSSVVSVLRQEFLWAHLLFLATLGALVVCLVVRFRHRNRALPATFVFLPFAFIAAALGSGATAAVLLGMRLKSESVITMADNLAFQGVAILMILGVGGFLIRSILGWLAPLPQNAREVPVVPSAGWREQIAHALCAAGILFSFWVEAFVDERLGAGLRAALVTAEAIGQIKIHRVPVSGKLTAHWLRLALWLMVLGLWAGALVPVQYRVACLHLCFAGGFTLCIIAIATRVILSHGGYSSMLSQAYRPFAIAAVLILIGTSTRFAGDIIPTEPTRHLAYAAAVWCLGLLVWSGAVLVRVLVAEPEPASHK